MTGLECHCAEPHQLQTQWLERTCCTHAARAPLTRLASHSPPASAVCRHPPLCCAFSQRGAACRWALHADWPLLCRSLSHNIGATHTTHLSGGLLVQHMTQGRGMLRVHNPGDRFGIDLYPLPQLWPAAPTSQPVQVHTAWRLEWTCPAQAGLPALLHCRQQMPLL